MTAAEQAPPVLSAEGLRVLARGRGDEQAAELLAVVRDGEWLDRQRFAPLRYVVPGVLPEGMALLVAPPKAGKSWMALGVALAAAAGGRALGALPVEQRPVLHLALEDGDRRMQDRSRSLLGTDPIPRAFHYVTAVQPGRWAPLIGAWLDAHHGHGPLIVVDTLGRVMPPALPGESAYGRDYRVGAQIKALVDGHPGAAVLVVHHDRKAGGDDFVDSVSGTHGLAGAADSVLVLVRPRGEDSAVLKVTGRDVPDAEYGLELGATGAWRVVGGSLPAAARHVAQGKVTAGLGDRSADLVAIISAHGDGGITVSEVARIAGLSPDDASTYLARLADRSRIRRVRRGVYGPLPTLPTIGVGSVGNPP